MTDRPGGSTAPPPATLTLADAVDLLAELATRAGADRRSGPQEALSMAAAVAESAPRAADDWVRVAGTDLSTQDFFDAASRGRRWRDSPTATLSALAAAGSPHAQEYARLLAEVASAACQLGEPTMRVIGNASVAAAAQLRAVPGRCRSTGARCPARQWTPTDPVAAAAPDPQATTPRPAEHPEKTLEELLAELDGLIGLERVKREIHRQVAVLRMEKLRAEAGLRESDDHPAPRLHRQPRHRQDHRGPSRQRDLPCARAAVQGPARRGRPLRAGGRLPRPDGDEDRRCRRLGRGRGAVHRRGLQPDRDRPARRPVRRRRRSTPWSRRWRTVATTWS